MGRRSPMVVWMSVLMPDTKKMLQVGVEWW